MGYYPMGSAPLFKGAIMKKLSLFLVLALSAFALCSSFESNTPEMTPQEMAEVESAFINAIAKSSIKQCSGKIRSEFCTNNTTRN